MPDFSYTFARAFSTPVTTPRLIIRPWHENDAKAVVEFYQANSRDYLKFIYGRGDPFPVTENVVRSIMNNCNDEYEDDAGLYRLFIHEQSLRHIIGEITVRQDSEGRTRLAPYILPSLRQMGYGREALENAFYRCIEEGMIPGGELYAEVFVENHVSRAFYQSLGFSQIAERPTTEHRVDDRLCAIFTRAIAAQPTPAPIITADKPEPGSNTLG